MDNNNIDDLSLRIKKINDNIKILEKETNRGKGMNQVFLTVRFGYDDETPLEIEISDYHKSENDKNIAYNILKLCLDAQKESKTFNLAMLRSKVNEAVLKLAKEENK